MLQGAHTQILAEDDLTHKDLQQQVVLEGCR